MYTKRKLNGATIHIVVLSVLMLLLSTMTFAQSSTDNAKKADGIIMDGQLNESVWDLNTKVSKVTEGLPDHIVLFDAVWDDTYLYVAGKILDDVLVADNGTSQPWYDDAFEIFIDANSNKGNVYDEFDRQYIVSYGSSTMWGENSTGVVAEWTEISGGFTVEVAIPWSNLGITPSNGTVIGFDIMADDDDDSGVREGQTSWSGDSNNWTSTVNFGSLQLTTESIDDTETPTNPENIIATSITSNIISISWDASSDNVEVAGYNVFIDGVLKEQVETTTYLFTGLLPSTTYIISLEAYDQAGNVSNTRGTLSVTTSAIAQVGVIESSKIDNTITIDGQLIENDWNLETEITKVIEGMPDHTVLFDVVWNDTYLYVAGKILDDVLVADNGTSQPWYDDAFEIFIDANNNKGTVYDAFDRQYVISYGSTVVWGENSTGVVAEWTEISGGFTVEVAIPWSNLGITPTNGTVIGLDIMCDDDDDSGVRDGQTAWSGDSNNWTSTVNFGSLQLISESIDDTEAPTIPENIVATSVTTTSISISWDASSDNIGVAGYNVFIDGVLKEQVETTTYLLDGLASGTTYLFSLEAYDLAGNVSTGSETFSVTTSAISQDGIVEAIEVGNTIVVDGQLDEIDWDLSYILSKVTEGSPNNTVTFGAIWNNEYLYIAGKVLDDSLVADNSTIPYQDDAFEVFIDADHNEGTTYDQYDRQYIVSYNSSTLWGSNAEGVESAWSAIDGCFTVEMGIPWSNLGITPSEGTTIGFDIMADDDDDGDDRDGQFVWTGDDDNWQSTANFGDLILVPAGDRYTLTVNSGSGDGRYLENTLVQISADAAQLGEVFDKWEGQITGIADFTSSVTNLTMPAADVTITATYKADPNPYLVVDPDNLSFSAEASTSEVSVFSNVVWTVVASDSWITVTSDATSEKLTVSVDENSNTESRTGSVTLTGDGISEKTVTIQQEGVEPARLEVSPASLQFSSNTSCKSIAIFSNTDWTVSESSGWATVSQTSGSGDASISICVDANTSGATRDFTVTISGTGVLDQTIQVNQSDDSGPVQNIGVNIGFPGGMVDYYVAKPFADAWKTSREYQWNGAPLDNLGWPTGDGEAIVYHGLDSRNNQGTYKLSFDCNSPSDVVVSTGDGILSNKQVNGNRVSMDLVIDNQNNLQLFLRFTNTNGGVRNVSLMRPLYPGSSESYPEGTIWMDQFLEALKPFKTLRYMDWMSIASWGNPNGEISWENRTPWNYATQNVKGTNDWDNSGASWESIILLSNATQTDPLIVLPIRINDDYIRNLAILFRDGNPDLGVPPLDPNLKLYIEWGNEIWNWGFGVQWDYVKTMGNSDPVTAFDGTTDVNERTFRYQAKRTVEISNIFREVFGDEAMPAPGKDPEQIRIRPYIGSFSAWYGLVKQNTMFIDHYYNKRHPASNYTGEPHPVNYYIYGYGGTTYWSTQDGNIPTLDQIWESGSWNSDEYFESLKESALCAQMYGLRYIAYEGGPHDRGADHVDAGVVGYATRDPRFYQKVIDQQNTFKKIGGDVNIRYTLMHAPADVPSNSDFGPVFSILERDITNLNTHRFRALTDISKQEPADVEMGNVPPFTVNGAAHDITERSKDPSQGTSKRLTAGGDYSAGYAVDVPATGIYNAEIQYSNGSGIIQIDVNGVTLGTYNVSGSGTTQAINFQCDYNTLYIIRVVCISGSVDINSVSVGIGNRTISGNELENKTSIANHQKSSLTIYPNPANDHLQVHLGEEINFAKIDLINMQGKIVSSYNVCSTNSKIDLAGIPEGVYILSSKTENACFTEKLTIKH
jgi:chitodextrinase